jgi:hypothetical protein
MLLSDIKKKVIKQLFLLVPNMVQAHQEIGLLKDHIFSELKLLLLNHLKEFTEAIWLVWAFYH